MALGTPAYMAPEQAAGDPNLDHRADLYAVGVLAYEMLTGRPPFTGLSPQSLLAAQVTGAVEPVTRYRENVPPALAALVMRCLAKRPADRWQSANEILEQLEQLATPTATTACEAAAAATRGHPARVAGLFAVGSLAVLGVVYFLMTQLGLPGGVMQVAIGLLVVGLPIMVATGLVERRRALAGGAGSAGVQRWFTCRRAARCRRRARARRARGREGRGAGPDRSTGARLRAVRRARLRNRWHRARLPAGERQGRRRHHRRRRSAIQAAARAHRRVAQVDPRERAARAGDHELARGAAQVLPGAAGQ